ncbi:hypothetical protein Mterra_02309 [Calidithermus terrae]|uniref:Uncharacterized protein n=1 Tax=Calidithermus terrae TaxID=1408545 RepID=A0A399EFF4_9DEIN|nr:hypothetical protein Mterra_02309 [Calidithermus terrae]
MGRAVRRYARAAGGGRVAPRAAIEGVRAGARLGRFFGQVATGGLGEAARALGITDLVGRTPEAILCGLVDQIAPAGETLEASAARAAIATTLDSFLERLDPDDPEATRLDAPQVEELMREYVINYAYERFSSEMCGRLERDQVDLDRALELSEQARDFIAAKLQEKLMDRAVDMNLLATDPSTQERVSYELMQETFAILEDGE